MKVSPVLYDAGVAARPRGPASLLQKEGASRPSFSIYALVGLTALIAAPPPVAATTCGAVPSTGSPPMVTCSEGAYPNGITYEGLRSGLALKVVPPSGGTAIDGDADGIKIVTTRGTTPVTADVKAGTKIGTPDDYMGNNGIDLDVRGAGDISVSNAGSIHVRKTGIRIERRSDGDVMVTNSGVIVSYNPETNKLNPEIKPAGIHVRMRAKGDVKIVNSGSVTSAWHAAIYAWYSPTAAEDEGSVEITSSGTVRSMVKHGILAQVDKAAIPATVTVTGGIVHGRDDGVRATNKGTGSSTARVSGSARIESDNEDGVHASAGDEEKDESEAAVLVDIGAGSMIVTRNMGGDDDESSHGVFAEHYGDQALSGDKTDTGSITVKSAGEISAAGSGHGVAALARGTEATVPISVEVIGGSITSGGDGVHADNKGKGAVAVTVGEKAMVKAKMNGVRVQGGSGRTVTINGKVTGGGGEHAGVRMVMGGKLVVGPKAEIGAASGVAVTADGALTITLNKDADGRVGHIMGKILNSGTTTFEGVELGEEYAIVAGDARGVYDVSKVTLKAIEGGHRFEESGRMYHDRARVYEALPSVLLDLIGSGGRAARLVATRDGEGVWARIVASDGEREADASTTSMDSAGHALSWDFERWGVETGFIVPTDAPGLTLGVSAHYRDGEADVERGGKIDASGMGVGFSATWRGEDGWYADGELSYTRFEDIDLSSDARGMVKSGLDGDGHAIGVEVGKRMEMDGMVLIPRGGLTWSSVDIDDFADVSGVPGSGRVEFSSEDSLKARIGALLENGPTYASLEVEHEFSEDRAVMASGSRLESEAESTWARVGVGGVMTLDAKGESTLSGEAHYAASGGDNHDYGVGVLLKVRF